MARCGLRVGHARTRLTGALSQDIPAQGDASNCALFMLANAECVCQGWDFPSDRWKQSVSTGAMPWFRKMLVDAALDCWAVPIQGARAREQDGGEFRIRPANPDWDTPLTGMPGRAVRDRKKAKVLFSALRE